MEYLKTQILNLSVWHNDTFGRNSFLGETEIDLSNWDFGNPRINCLPLRPRVYYGSFYVQRFTVCFHSITVPDFTDF